MSSMWTILVILLLIVIAVVSLFYIPRFMVRKAMKQIIRQLRGVGATSIKRAVTLEDIGIITKGIVGRMFSVRDYRPMAIRMLVQSNVLQETDSGKIFLSESTLADSPIQKFVGLSMQDDTVAPLKKTRRVIMSQTCQSCGMQMENEENWGTEADDSKSKYYCMSCYRKGEFTDPDLTMEQQIVNFVDSADQVDMTTRQALSYAEQLFPKLKRWK